MPLKETEYVVQQYYTVKIDEKAIDRHIDAVVYPIEWEADREKDREFLHRLFHAIMADRKALNTVLEYMALLQMDGNYISEQYGKDLTFADILFIILLCFSREDQARLEKMKRDEEASAEPDLNSQLEALTDAFQWEPSGFHVKEGE